MFSFAGGGSPVNAPFPFVLAPYNDSAAALAAIEQHGAELAAVILEPMIGSGGCIPAAPEFLAALRDATTRVGALLILDEVMTSRLSPGGLQAVRGVKPDLTTLGKYIGGGMSFGAFGGRADIMDLFDPRRPDALPHAGTFNNNVLTMSAGLTGLTEIYTPDAARALNARGDALRDRLNGLCRAVDAPLQFTGIGSMLAVHAMRGAVQLPPTRPRADAKLKELFFFDMLAHGIWLARRGMFDAVAADRRCGVRYALPTRWRSFWRRGGPCWLDSHLGPPSGPITRTRAGCSPQPFREILQLASLHTIVFAIIRCIPRH